MGPLQQVLLLALCLLVSLPLWGIVLHRRRNVSGPSRVKAPDHYTSEPSGVKAPVHEVNDSLDRFGKQSDVPTMQILFFHGFPLEDFSNVHLSTWDNGGGFIWPQAWLVEKFPGAQIFFVKYGAALRNSKVFNMNNIAENLISDLLQANIGQVRDCPVVMVGHCVGGLVIKALCWKAHEVHSSDTSMNDRAKKLKAFLERVSGIFYYSTPHHGFREIPEGLRSSDNALFTYLQVLSTHTAVLNSNFSKLCKRYRKWKIEGVGESLPAKLGVFKNILVVPEASARDGVQVFNVLKEEDHFSVCKPKTITSGGFYHLTGFLTEIEEEEIKLREETRHENIEIELKAGPIRPENFQIISKAVVGIQIPLQAVIRKLKAISTLGLTGMGGSGKTTLAKAVFNELCCEFEYTCFVPDVKLIEETVGKVEEEIWKHVYCNGIKVGGDMRWSLLRGKRLLLVLDDISDDRDMTVLLEIAEGPSLESRFIATSRNDDLFEFFYKVPLLDENTHGRELFMSYAFPNNETPSPQLRSLTEEIVKKCEGLPLTLEVLGKRLRRTKHEEVWKQTLNALDKAESVTDFNERLWAKLRPSIDALEENERKMFLDATAFFYHSFLTLKEAKAAWRVVYNGVSELLWLTLVDRSLVYDVDEHECINVHEQLRSLGRKIANESKAYIDITKLEDLELLQSTPELEKRNIHALRINIGLSDGEKIRHVIPRFTGVSDVEVHSVDGTEIHSFIMESAPISLYHSDTTVIDLFPRNTGLSDEEENQARESISESISDDGDSEPIRSPADKIHIAKLALEELKELRYLEINIHREIDVAVEEILFPSRLVLLSCSGLKTLNLALQRRLAVLNIVGVESLPSSIGQLSALRFFTLDTCCLEFIPEEIGNLSELECLEIRSCESLQTLPDKLGQLSKLKILHITCCKNLSTLPEFFGKLSSLEILKFYICGLETLPESFGDLAALVDLKFENCNSLKSLPETFGQLSALRRLEFSRCTYLESLPESFGKLSALNYLRFHECGELVPLKGTIGISRALFDMMKFKDVRCIPTDSLPKLFRHLPASRRLEDASCSSLKCLPISFGKLSALNYLQFQACLDLESLPESFGLLVALVDLKFEDCYSLESLPKTFGQLSSLSHLEFDGCNQLRSLPESVGNLPVLRHLKLSSCDGLHHLPESLGGLANLEYLEIDDLKELKRLPDSVAELGSLRHLTITKLFSLKSIPDYIRNLPSLHILELGELPHVKELPPWLGETGVNCLGQSRKVFRIQDHHFSLTRDEIVVESFELIAKIQSRAMDMVRTSDYEGALAELEVSSLGIPELDGFLLQEKGIIKRIMGDLDGALDGLNAALECFSKADDRRQNSYDCWKQRGYVKFLIGDIEGAENDGTMALKLQLDYCGSVLSAHESDSLGNELIEYLHFRLDTLQAMQQHERLVESTWNKVLQKVKVPDFEGALASFEVINVLLLRRVWRQFFLLERGVLKRLAGDLGGALEDLTAALEASGEIYDILKHRGYVKYLLGDLDGARLDAERCFLEELPCYEQGAQHLAEASVAFMEYDLE